MPTWGQPGDTLLWDAGHEGWHLWVVVTDPDPDDHKQVLVMIVSARRHTDKTLSLPPGSHPFIQHESHLDYGGARPFPQSKIATAIAHGKAKLQPPLAPEWLERVREAILQSARTIHDVADRCRKAFGRAK